MEGKLTSGNILLGTTVVILIIAIVYNLCEDRKQRENISGAAEGSTGGAQDVQFITARTYGQYPSTVAESARSAGKKAGGSASLYGVGQGGDAKQQILSSQKTTKPHRRPTHAEDEHGNPLLEHQKVTTGGNVPTVQGDPIRTPTYVGPSVAGYRLHTMNIPTRWAYDTITTPDFASDVAQTDETQETKAQRGSAGGQAIDTFRFPFSGPPSAMGPYPGKPLNVPVPRGSLKKTSEEYGYPFYRTSRPLKPYDYFRPYGPNQNVNQEASYADTPFYSRDEAYNGVVDNSIPFISSVNAFAPFPEVNTPWEKTGLITSDSDKTGMMTLYRRPIAPLQDLFKYSVQDKNGFIIPLKETYLENGDIVPNVIGKDGPWKTHIFTQDKYVWV